MGQMTIGLLYGTQAPTSARTTSAEEYEEPLHDLLCRFHAAAGLLMYPPWGSDQLTVSSAYEGGTVLVGVWVAVGGSGVGGAEYFVEQAVPLAQVADLYAETLRKAQALWDRFVAYCAEEEQLELAPATLWLTPTEVA